MLKPPRHPYGFKNLLAYKKAEELQMECVRITAQFPKYKTLISLADQMDRSARSTKQNIVEGWKRNSTEEYYEFLGFSIGANTELEEDCNDIWKGACRDLMGIKGIMGETGGPIPSTPLNFPLNSQNNSIQSEHQDNLLCQKQNFQNSPMQSNPTLSSVPLSPFCPLVPFDIEKIPFYPLDKNLPPIVQLKLRCKELNYLLHQLQKSLENKMIQEKNLTAKDLAQNRNQEIRKEQKWEDTFLEENGFEKLENGQVIKKKNKKCGKSCICGKCRASGK